MIDNLYQDGLVYFGHKKKELSIELANIWHDDTKNLNGRWKEIETFNDHNGKILDMACGVGTFLFYGLHQGYDVYGIEPEAWKLEYMNLKIDELQYPQEWKERIIEGVGENLPFPDNNFDYIGTYQTLEHVQDVEKCIDELVRVLKIGGRMKIQAPDYDSFFEPHYMLPFFPKMNKKLAFLYLKLLGRPSKGLETLTWTTSQSVKKHLNKYEGLEIIDLYALRKNRKINHLKNKYYLPDIISKLIVDIVYYKNIYFCKSEKQINLIVKKKM